MTLNGVWPLICFITLNALDCKHVAYVKVIEARPRLAETK